MVVLIFVSMAMCLALSGWAGLVFAAESEPLPPSAGDDSAYRIAVPDDAQRERARRTLEAMRFEEGYNALIIAMARSGDPSASEEAPESPRARNLLVELLVWPEVADLWREAIARGLSASQLDRISAFYRSEAGQAYADCQARGSGLLRLESCRDELSEDHRLELLRFEVSDAGQAMHEASSRMTEPLMETALRRGLRRHPEIAAEFAQICKQTPLDICHSLPGSGTAESEIW